MDNFDELLERTKTKSGMMSLSKNKLFKAEVLERTKAIDDMGFESVPLKTRCLYLLNGSKWPTCSECNNPCTWVKRDHALGWTKTCSKECQTKVDSTSKLGYKAKKYLNDKEWLFDKRINQKWSIDQIAEHLKCSHPTVKKYIEQHGIPYVRYNASDCETEKYLSDKEWLYEEHVVNKRNLEDIALQIGSSPSTISVRLREFGIPANEANSYDRPDNPVTKPTREIGDFIKSLGFEIKYNNRSILGDRELDIVIESAKMAIEFNGIYHHTYRPWEEREASRKGPDYHLDKTVRCQEKGYSLIHVFSDDWRLRRPIVESIIRSKLGQCTRIPARKCTVIEVPQMIRSAFMRANHIQGDSPARYSLGLVYEDELVACMTFGKSRFDKAIEWELVRFASKLNMTVVGGFSKLLKAWDRSGSIVSYADRTISDGNVYRKNGFELTRVNRPGYWYVKGDTKYHRSRFMKKRVAPNDPRPEHVIMAERGYQRMFNCGTLVFVKRQ